jgi:hypothetical protein
VRSADSLIEAVELPNVALRVLPFAAGAHPGMDGSFTVLEFSDASNPRMFIWTG